MGKVKNIIKEYRISLIVGAVLISAFCFISSLGVSNNIPSNDIPRKVEKTEPYSLICDGKDITTNCTGSDGKKYTKYINHDYAPAVTKEVNHPATQEKSHIVHHEAQYENRRVKDCIRTNIGYKSGTCALSRCRDGAYSGSAGRGTCSHHGGVGLTGGPWYEYHIETVLVTPAWDEKVIDEPAKPAWTETVIVTPEREAYTEKVLAE